MVETKIIFVSEDGIGLGLRYEIGGSYGFVLGLMIGIRLEKNMIYGVETNA